MLELGGTQGGGFRTHGQWRGWWETLKAYGLPILDLTESQLRSTWPRPSGSTAGGLHTLQRNLARVFQLLLLLGGEERTGSADVLPLPQKLRLYALQVCALLVLRAQGVLAVCGGTGQACLLRSRATRMHVGALLCASVCHHGSQPDLEAISRESPDVLER